MSISNEDFSKLPRAQQRVEIARDALQFLPKLVPERGIYLQMSGRLKAPWNAPLGDVLPEINSNCKVCALGALMVGAMERVDGRIGEILRSSYLLSFAGFEIRNKISTFFTGPQMSDIERAFEYPIDCPLTKDAPNSTERLRLILQSIIDNHGEFSYEDAPPAISGQPYCEV